jgi:hypothetical protein
MAGVATKIRSRLKVDRSADEIGNELRELQRLHLREFRGFKQDAHDAVERFTLETRQRLAARTPLFLANPAAMFDNPLEAKVAALVVFSSDAFAAELHAAIDGNLPDGEGRVWSPISRAEYDAKVAELKRELAKVAVAGELDEVEQLEAEARERRAQIEARAAEVVEP